eukprot:g1508.t1
MIFLLGFSLTSLAGSAEAGDQTYLDDRSTPQKLVESYYSAIGQHNYAQAFSYFAEGSAPKDFKDWVKGYADTGSVQVKFGDTAPDPGAGQIYWSLPVAISASKTDGSDATYTGCYKIHLTNPGMQTAPPFQPMGIVSAVLRQSKATFDDAVPGPC